MDLRYYCLEGFVYFQGRLIVFEDHLFSKKIFYFILNDLKINLTVYFVHYCGLPNCHSSKSSSKIK